MSAEVLMPVAIAEVPESWNVRDPAPFGLDVDILLVHEGGSPTYTPSLTVARRPVVGDLEGLADATVVACGTEARVVERAVGDASVSQVIARPGPAEDELYVVEAIMRWPSSVDELDDTDVVVRLMALDGQVQDLTPDLARLVGAMKPAVGLAP